MKSEGVFVNKIIFKERLMSITNSELGPLAVLLGKWQGESGEDIAPEPDGTEENAYYETLEFKAVPDVDNAEEQTLTTLQYEQYVIRKSAVNKIGVGTLNALNGYQSGGSTGQGGDFSMMDAAKLYGVSAAASAASGYINRPAERDRVPQQNYG